MDDKMLENTFKVGLMRGIKECLDAVLPHVSKLSDKEKILKSVDRLQRSTAKSRIVIARTDIEEKHDQLVH